MVGGMRQGCAPEGEAVDPTLAWRRGSVDSEFQSRSALQVHQLLLGGARWLLQRPA